MECHFNTKLVKMRKEKKIRQQFKFDILKVTKNIYIMVIFALLGAQNFKNVHLFVTFGLDVA